MKRTDVPIRANQLAELLAKPLPTWPRTSVIATTSEGTIGYWNAGAERLYGWSAQEALGQVILDLNQNQQTRDKSAEVLAYLQAGRVWVGNAVRRRRSGLPVCVFAIGFPVGDLAHGRGAVVGLSVPIAQRSRLLRDGPRIYAELQRRFASAGVPYFVRGRTCPVAPESGRRAGVYEKVGPTEGLAALHRKTTAYSEPWRLMQRIEAYRHRADRVAGPDGRVRLGGVSLARMWRRLAQQLAASNGGP